MTNADSEKQLELVLSKEEAHHIYAKGPEAVAFKLLELSQRIKELEGSQPIKSSTPSGQVPVYQKPSAGKSKKKPGRKKGHEGARHSLPAKIDRQVKHTLDCCPACGDPLGKATRLRKRIIEDIPEVEPEATEHEIEGYWCKTCKKIVEPLVTDA